MQLTLELKQNFSFNYEILNYFEINLKNGIYHQNDVECKQLQRNMLAYSYILKLIEP